MTVLHLRKQLTEPPVDVVIPTVVVRSMSVPHDVARWLALRERAMAGQIPAVRPWTYDDFCAELAVKTWWRTEHTWLAVAGPPRGPRSGDHSTPPLIGAVTLAVREGTAGRLPVVHWLLVDPAWRRRGIGRLLMSQLERAAWDAGWREIGLETHRGWTDAVAFYQSMGFAPPCDRSPR